jgi:hypothetical protein
VRQLRPHQTVPDPPSDPRGRRMTTPAPLRPLPAPRDAQSICEGCAQPIVWAVTVAGPNGRGGRLMPMDPLEDLTGNVAITAPTSTRLLARVLTKGEEFDRPVEYAGMTHFATCPTRTKPEPPFLMGVPQDRKPGRHRRTPRPRTTSGRPGWWVR